MTAIYSKIRNSSLLRVARVFFILTLVVTSSAPSLAFALSLDAAKSQGLIGEKPSGYLGIVNPPGDAAVQQLVNEINSQRRAKYLQIANKNGTALVAVEQLAGKKAIEKTDPGNYVEINGNWKRK